MYITSQLFGLLPSLCNDRVQLRRPPTPTNNQTPALRMQYAVPLAAPGGGNLGHACDISALRSSSLHAGVGCPTLASCSLRSASPHYFRKYTVHLEPPPTHGPPPPWPHRGQSLLRGTMQTSEAPSTKALNNPPILSPPKGGHLRLPVSQAQMPPLGGRWGVGLMCLC